jgi:hypothetical protein
MTSGRTGHWTKMRQSLVKFSESEASNHTPSLADFTTTTPELKFSVHTPIDCVPVSLDQHQRTVAVCGIDGVDLADWLVRNGFALDWPQ